MKWTRSKEKDKDSGRCSYTYGRWTVQTYKEFAWGWRRTNYFQWEVLLDGETYWDDRGARNLCPSLKTAKYRVETEQKKWERQSYLIVSNTGALNSERAMKRIKKD